jgi:CheY-like chemotaxis protein
MLQRLIGENIRLEWNPGTSLWPLRLDPGQLDQILANLCVNARDAIAGVGKITIRTANQRFDGSPDSGAEAIPPGEYVELAVSDTGSGMSAEVLEHLFEPFFTTKPVGQGTGLGLATVYGIVRQNQGQIRVSSEPGKGSSFSILFPRFAGKESATGLGEAKAEGKRGHETILLVEDEAAILGMARRMLEGLGYRVLAAGSPVIAIRMAEEFPGTIDLLMTDVIMPELNGKDLARRILNLYPNMKRLFTSGYTADVIAHHGIVEEGVPFIQKPFSRADLGAKIRAVLDSD